MQLSILFLTLFHLITISNADVIRLQHWNLRYDSKKDGESINTTLSSLSSNLPDESTINWYGNSDEVSWSKRRIGIVNDVLFNKADIFSVNEALENQVSDIKDLLNLLDDEFGDWDYIGVGREDGDTKGEYEAIFYDKNKFNVDDSYTVWLSDTPLEPSIYPGAGSYRTATIGNFQKLSTMNSFTVICSHLDDRSDDQRRLGSSILKQIGSYEYMNSDGPVFLVADFNSNSEGDTDGAYKIAIGKEPNSTINSTFVDEYSSSISNTFTWTDLYSSSDSQDRLGHFATSVGFKSLNDFTGFRGRIDFLFGGFPNDNSQDVPVKSFEVLKIKVGEIFYDNEWHLSDHRPIIADVEF